MGDMHKSVVCTWPTVPRYESWHQRHLLARVLVLEHLRCRMEMHIRLEGRNHGVEKDAAHTANWYRVRLTLAGDTILRLGVHAAVGVGFAVALQADVALLAPVIAPRVLDHPVLDTGLFAIADGRHRMIND